MVSVTRRPWLVVAVLLMLGISATMLVKSSRTYRPDDAIAQTFDEHVAPCTAPVLAPVLERVAIITIGSDLESLVESEAVIALAPKTSPPR